MFAPPRAAAAFESSARKQAQARALGRSVSLMRLLMFPLLGAATAEVAAASKPMARKQARSVIHPRLTAPPYADRSLKRPLARRHKRWAIQERIAGVDAELRQVEEIDADTDRDHVVDSVVVHAHADTNASALLKVNSSNRSGATSAVSIASGAAAGGIGVDVQVSTRSGMASTSDGHALTAADPLPSKQPGDAVPTASVWDSFETSSGQDSFENKDTVEDKGSTASSNVGNKVTSADVGVDAATTAGTVSEAAVGSHPADLRVPVSAPHAKSAQMGQHLHATHGAFPAMDETRQLGDHAHAASLYEVRETTTALPAAGVTGAPATDGSLTEAIILTAVIIVLIVFIFAVHYTITRMQGSSTYDGGRPLLEKDASKFSRQNYQVEGRRRWQTRNEAPADNQGHQSDDGFGETSYQTRKGSPSRSPGSSASKYRDRRSHPPPANST